MYPITKYKFYTTPNNTTIAVSSFAGKKVKGIAKVHPKDTFDPEYGKQLAAARCNLKIAKKRKTRADKQVTKAYAKLREAYSYVEKMKKYQEDSDINLEFAIEKMKEFNL